MAGPLSPRASLHPWNRGWPGRRGETVTVKVIETRRAHGPASEAFAWDRGPVEPLPGSSTCPSRGLAVAGPPPVPARPRLPCRPVPLVEGPWASVPRLSLRPHG